ncbi:MAG: TonB-dependent receptor [Paludibacteraceae bacterium]|nr:TonB-dependent receptor [Paludibacteraceae bacterium]
MRHMKTRHYIFAALMFLTMPLYADVTGLVLDETGEPVIGASILIEGTTTGTITDLDGNFTIDATDGQMLVISYMGYATQTVAASNNLKVTLLPDTKVIEEVVVIGYGASKKSNISGSVEMVKADDLPKAASASVGEMLRGRTSGMFIQSNSASPGASQSITIRGGLSGQKPLVVIDGVPQLQTGSLSSGTGYSGSDKDNSLINISPDDIESINILKDASAASIYGSDASGGVILITTKRGKQGKPEVSYSGSVAFQTMKDKPEFLDAKGFMTEQNKVFDELGRADEQFYTQEQIDNYVGKGTDWMKKVTRMGLVNEHNLSVNGGSENTKYLFSVGIYDHKGIAKNNDMQRITGRVNLDQNFGKYVRAGINTSFTSLKYNDVPLGDSRQSDAALIYSAMTFNPTVPVYNLDGTYADNPNRPNIYPNPVSLLDITDQSYSRDVFLTGYLEIKPIQDLTIRATGGIDMKFAGADQYIPTTTLKGASVNGQASKQTSNNKLGIINATATYAHNWNGEHDLSVMAGWEWKKNMWDGHGVVTSDFPTDNALMNNIGTAEMENPNIWSSKGSSQMASFIGRASYTALNRYIVTFNIRVDGSSNFSPQHQWGAFPGVSAAWRISEEPWMQKATWLSELKLRGGYGQTGNAGSLTGIRTIYGISRGSYVFDGTLSNGINLSKLGNPDLKWETLSDANIAIDFGFFKGRLTGTLEFYQRDRTDVIMSKSLMSYNEINTIDYNSQAAYRSRGVELTLHTVNVDTKLFGWTSDVCFSYYRNRTVSRDPDFLPAPYQDMVEDWGNVYGYKTNGLVQPGQDYPHLPNSKPGSINYLDINGFEYEADGKTPRRDAEGRYVLSGKPDGKLDQADIVKLGNNTPIPFSFNNTFRIWDFDLNIYIYGSLNGYKLNDVLYQSSYGIADLVYGVNALTQVRNRWTYQNQEGTLPGVAEANSGINPANSDFFYEKAWFLRLDNISLGYNFPTRWFKGYVKSARIYAAVRNVAVMTPYKGMDPETGNGIGAYPNQMSAAIGLSFKF